VATDQFFISREQAEGLIFMSRMNTITADQFMRESGQSKRHTSDFLRKLYRHNMLGRSGGIILDGKGRKPYIYWISKKGYKHLCDEEGLADILGEYRAVKRTLTVKELQKGYEFIGTAFEVDTFEHELSVILEKFESDIERLLNDDDKITVRRGKVKP